ncbi:MAG: DNA primase [Muribaculum sp.]|nr:DNA primase [Muribaculum sp.]
MISKSTIQHAIDAADVYDVLSDFLPDLRKNGSAYICCCPFHSERTPSFRVTPARNRWHCFSCKKGGDAVEFLREHQKMSFSEAIEYLCCKYGIPVEYDKKERSQEDIDLYKKKESMIAALAAVQEFFVEQLQSDTPEATKAREYAYGRWGEEYCKEFGVGYAPQSSQPLLDFTKKRCLDLSLLIEAGVISKGDKGNYAFMRQRVTLPIRGDWGKVIAWTGRYIGDRSDVGKYMNPPTSIIFDKSQTWFGFDAARRQCSKVNQFIIVEGAPDVMRLQIAGLTEAVAPLGTALTDKHLDKLKRLCKTLRFIPDSDPPKGGTPWGAGVQAVMKNGEAAIRKGFDVYVREIPRTDEDDKAGVKNDPDSFIVNKEAYNSLEDKHFLIWFGEKRFAQADSADASFVILREIAELILFVNDELIREMCIDQLAKIYGGRKSWSRAIKSADKKARAKADEEDNPGTPKERELLRKFGIVIRNNMYYGPGKSGELERWSNFIMIPHFHVKRKSSLRKFTMVNEYGETEVLAINQAKFTSASNFATEAENQGNYVWLGKQEAFNRVKEYLYAITVSLDQISILGWQPKLNFYAFADGIHDCEKFYPIDERGMVSYNGKQYFLPAYAEENAEEDGYDFEKKVVYAADNEDTLRQFVQRLIDVFGNGAKVGFAWVIACLFRDYIYKWKDWFPVLNLFGIRGSGKTALASALNSFFYPLRQDPPKLGNTTVAAVTYMLDHLTDGVVVLDEYTNLLKDKIVDVLKGLWGGTTNTRKNMQDSDKGISSGKVFSGVVICGQHMPTKDSALLTRCIHLTYWRTSFSDEENLAFTRLKEAAKKGNAHLTMQILSHREDFIANYKPTYQLTRREVKSRFKGVPIDDRILDNWVAALAAFRTLETHLDVPFTYAELFDICIEGLKHQNREATKTSETADFWEMVNAMHMAGKVFYDTHFIVNMQTSFTPQKGVKLRQEFPTPKKLLWLNWPLLKELLRLRPGLNQMKMDLDALEDYLRHCPQYLGSRQKKFVRLNAQGAPDVIFENSVKKSPRTTTWSMVFDYEALKAANNIDLEASVTAADSDNDDEDDETPTGGISPSVEPPKEASLFPPADDEPLPF